MEVGIAAPVTLVIGFPIALIVMLTLLAWLENWMVRPDERAAAVRDLLERVDQVEEIERAVTELLAVVADAPQQSRRSDEIKGSVPAKSGVS